MTHKKHKRPASKIGQLAVDTSGVNVDASDAQVIIGTAAISVTLPPADEGALGAFYFVKNGAPTGPVIVAAAPGDTLDGSGEPLTLVNKGDAIMVACTDVGGWSTLASKP